METQETLQRVIDVIGLGRILRWEVVEDVYVATTNQDELAIFVDDEALDERRSKEAMIEAHIKKLLGATRRVLMTDYQGNLEQYSSYVHQNHQRYSIYKIAVPSEPGSN